MRENFYRSDKKLCRENFSASAKAILAEKQANKNEVDFTRQHFIRCEFANQMLKKVGMVAVQITMH